MCNTAPDPVPTFPQTDTDAALGDALDSLFLEGLTHGAVKLGEIVQPFEFTAAMANTIRQRLRDKGEHRKAGDPQGDLERAFSARAGDLPPMDVPRDLPALDLGADPISRRL